MDLPKLHSNRLQQIHPRQEALQLALPDHSHHDPHVLLLDTSDPPHQSLQTRRAGVNVARDLPQISRTHRSTVLSLPLALQLRLHLPLRLLHTDAQSSDAGGRLLHRRLLQERIVQV